MTYGAVLFTLLAQGLTVGPLVRALGLGNAPPDAGPLVPVTVAPDGQEAPVMGGTDQPL